MTPTILEILRLLDEAALLLASMQETIAAMREALPCTPSCSCGRPPTSSKRPRI